jgi:hypothetical protein
VAVPDAELARAVARASGVTALAARIVASGARVIAIGTDRFDPDRGRGHRLDPTTAALALGRALPSHGLLVAVAPTREHPYNVARRVLSLDHVLDGRVGLIVGVHDHGLPAPQERHEPAEFAAVVRGLWRTWPLDSIVGDRGSGRFADTDRIRPLDHDGGPEGYRVRGPLTTPSSRQGEPVLAVWHDVVLPSGAAAGDVPDLVLGGAAHPLAPLPPAASVTEPHRASGPTDGPDGLDGPGSPDRPARTDRPDRPDGSVGGRPTLRTLLGLRDPGTVTA